MKKIVQFESFSSIYNENLQKELKKHDKNGEQYQVYSVNLEDEVKLFSDVYRDLEGLNKFQKAIFWIKFNRYLKKKYDYLKEAVVNVQYVGYQYLYLIPFLKSIFSKIVLSFWGSDLLRQDEKKFVLMKPLFRCADVITFETKEMKNIFLKKVGQSFCDKIKIVKFGIPCLEIIDSLSESEVETFREKYDISEHKKCIVIGYNRNKAHQHLAVVDSIFRSNINLSDIFVVFPWTYGPVDDEYKKEIEELISDRFSFVFIEEKLSDNEIACLRKVTDILIQVQTTDALSSTMLETLYAENEVLTGSWLPYESLDRDGIHMTKVNSVKEVGSALENMMNTPLDKQVRERNKDLIWQMSSWEVNINRWMELY